MADWYSITYPRRQAIVTDETPPGAAPTDAFSAFSRQRTATPCT